jgi:hypothetical protein
MLQHGSTMAVPALVSADISLSVPFSNGAPTFPQAGLRIVTEGQSETRLLLSAQSLTDLASAALAATA